MQKLSFALGILVLPFVFSSLQAQIAEARIRTATISGRVVLKGEPAQGVLVYLHPIGSPAPSNPDSYLRARTDEEGQFRITGVAAGAYYVIPLAPGFVYSADDEPGPRGKMINVSEGENVENIDLEPYRGGVITGRVTDSQGRPLVRAPVTLGRLDKDGRPRFTSSYGSSLEMYETDDRGVYRFYRLRPGIYVVFTRGNMPSSPISPYEGYSPTYHPSSPRGTAAEIMVTDGGEATGIDIRYRGERGHTVNGVASVGNAAPQGAGISVALYNVSSGFIAGIGNIWRVEEQNGFTIKGVTDGEYEIIARTQGTESGESIVSPPRRVTVRGVDVGGIKLKLAPLASISGKVVVEASPNACEGGRKSSLSGIVVGASPDTKAISDARQFGVFRSGGSVSEQGEFKISDFDPGHYFISLRLLDENWYAKSIAAPAAPARSDSARAVATHDVGRHGLTLKSGDKMSGLIVTIANGAASLRGRVAPESEGSPLPARMRIHLVPAEAAAADDLLRYGEVAVGKDNAFEFKNMAPGKYRLLARAAPDDEPGDSPPAPVAWDANERAKLRREAEASKIEVELKPCQRALNQLVKYPAK